MGKYLVQGWQYWPNCREGQYTTRELILIVHLCIDLLLAMYPMLG